MNTYKFKLFNFVGAPVELNIFFLVLFAITTPQIAIAVFISILLHEMAHAWMANRKGYNVYGIEISLFSGSAAIDTNIHERDSIPIIAAGPISNLLIFIVAFGLNHLYPTDFLYNLTWINLLLFSFNSLPIYPMDGGQILNDLLVRKMRNRTKAINIASIVSLFTSVILSIGSLLFGFYIMFIFSLYFIYIACKKLNLF
jgi:Zn-dependent protease